MIYGMRGHDIIMGCGDMIYGMLGCEQGLFRFLQKSELMQIRCH